MGIGYFRSSEVCTVSPVKDAVESFRAQAGTA
jgi:hypothetical protein